MKSNPLKKSKTKMAKTQHYFFFNLNRILHYIIVIKLIISELSLSQLYITRESHILPTLSGVITCHFGIPMRNAKYDLTRCTTAVRAYFVHNP